MTMVFPLWKRDGKMTLAIVLSINMYKEGMLFGFLATRRPGSQPGSKETRGFGMNGCALEIWLWALNAYWLGAVREPPVFLLFHF